MRGTLLVVTAAVGALVGAAVMHSVDRPTPRVPTLTADSERGGQPLPPDTAGSEQADHSTTAERAELYRVAAAANETDLAAMIRSAALQSPSPARTFALGVLLARYAELNPAAAVAAAADLTADLRAPLYAAWAAKDPTAALDALAKIEDHAAARTIAAALVQALGGNEQALRQVAAAVPFGVESGVYADAITKLAVTDPAAALAQALALPDNAARSMALDGVATTWAQTDPRAALAAARAVRDPLVGQPLLASIARTWARLDSDAALAYLAALDRDAEPNVFGALAAPLAQLRPRELLALADGRETPTQISLRMMALQALANQDPELALREAEALPAGSSRMSAMSAIARSFGARDPDAALAWARASGDTTRLIGVLQGIAQRDPARAFELALALDSPTQRMQAVQIIVMAGGLTTPAAMPGLADRVLALPDSASRTDTLRQLLGVWSSRAPDAAVEWLLTHQVADARGTYQQVGQQLARTDPVRAADYTVRIPADARTEWLQGVAEGYAQRDPEAAAQWLAQYRGDPAYPAAVGAVAAGLAATDPAAAARLLATGDQTSAQRAAGVIAYSWAQRDPRAAAAWAAGYDAGLERPFAIPGVVTIWAQSDAPAARAWTLQLPPGTTRDAALQTLLQQTAVANAVDGALLEAFSSPQARNSAAVNVAMQLAARDRAAAERFLDTYVTDQQLRDQVKRNLERQPPNVVFDAAGAQLVSPSGIGIVRGR